MNRRWIGFALLLIALLVIDWIAGVLITHDVLPIWVYVILNVPFGIVYVLSRFLWTGVRYELLGQPIAGMWISAVQLLAVIAQAVVYWLVWRWLRQRNRRAGENKSV